MTRRWPGRCPNCFRPLVDGHVCPKIGTWVATEEGSLFENRTPLEERLFHTKILREARLPWVEIAEIFDVNMRSLQQAFYERYPQGQKGHSGSV